MKRFFIYSLPRSGSAWLSVFLSGNGSFCYHEPFADGGWEALWKRWKERPEGCVGAVDTSAYKRESHNYIGIDHYVLIRNKMEIDASLKQRGWIVNLTQENDIFESVTRSLPVISYSKLWNVGYLAELWQQIVGTSFDRERAEYLIEMNIQRGWRAVARRAFN